MVSNKTSNPRKSLQRGHFFQFSAVLVIILLANYMTQFVNWRIDLTEEKRHTLSNASIKVLENLDDVIYFKVYLDGDEIPAGFIRLQTAIKDMLNEFRQHAGDNIQYEFIDPFESPDLKTRGEIGRQLMKKGLNPTTIAENDAKGGASEKLLFSGAIASYREDEIPVEFLKNNLSFSGEENLNQSIQLIEFELIQSIVKLKTVDRKHIAFIEGHGECQAIETASLEADLKDQYEVSHIEIKGQLNALAGIDCIILAGPQELVNEQDKYIIDQFIMKGGKSIWLVDGVAADMDSLAKKASFVAMLQRTNLEDQLFKYGARINPDLIQDMNCGGLKINTAPAGVQPTFRLFPWVYFPLLFSNNDHIIGKNLDLVKSEFCSSLDTIGGTPQVKKTFLLFSSQRAKLVNVPALINLDIINEALEERNFPLAFIPTAVLLEGSFTSLYKNRLSPEFTENSEIHFLETGKETSMLLCSDANLIRNQVRRAETEMPFPLGYDRHTDMTFNGNKDFFLNVLSYMLDTDQLIEVRNREIKLRLLDKKKSSYDRLTIQAITILTPILFVFISAIFIFLIRRKKYAIQIKN